MRKLFLIIFPIFLYSCMDPQDTDIGTNKYYSFDGEYILSQNWYSERDFFDDNECNLYEWCGKSERDIMVSGNQFTFVDYYGDQRACKFFQNLNLGPEFKKVILHCFGQTHDEIYEVNFDEGVLIQEYPTTSSYKLKLEPTSEKNIPKTSNIKRGQEEIFQELNESIISEMELDDDFDVTDIFRADESGYFVYAEEIILDDGSTGGEIGGAVADGVCSYFGMPSELCYEIGRNVGTEVNKNDGSVTTQNLCIFFIHVGLSRIIDEFMIICESFDHPTSSDFQPYMPTQLYYPYHTDPIKL